MKMAPLLVVLLAAAALLLSKGRRRQIKAPPMTYEVDSAGLVTLTPGLSTVRLDPPTMDAWRALVNEWGEPLKVKDSYRPTGGAKKSQHKQGHALDVATPSHARAGRPGAIEWRRRFVGAAQRAGFNAFGLGFGTIHIDTGPARWWTYEHGSDVGYPEKLEARFSDRVPVEFADAGNKVPDLSGVA